MRYLSSLGPMWQQARLSPTSVYLNSASASRADRTVIAAMQAYLESEAREGPYEAAARVAGQIEQCRHDVAALLGYSGADLTFTDSAMSSLRAILAASFLPRSARVWVCAPEYGPSVQLFAHYQFTVEAMDSIDATGRVDVDALQRRLRTEQPDVIHICHIASYNGVVQPARAIVDVAHAAGVPVIVDAAQAIGHVDAVTGADATYATSRKWLTGPRGVGFICIQPDGLLPLSIDEHTDAVVERIGLSVAIATTHRIGAEQIMSELAQVGQHTRERLGSVPGWRNVEPIDEPTALVTISSSDGDAHVHAAYQALLARGVITTYAEPSRAPMLAGSASLRLSPHLDATHEELDIVAEVLAR